VYRGGAYGTVRVHYRTYAVDTVSEATADGRDILDYYNSPLSGTPLPLAAQTGTTWDVTSLPNPLKVCTAHRRQNRGEGSTCPLFLNMGALNVELACAPIFKTVPPHLVQQDGYDHFGL